MMTGKKSVHPGEGHVTNGISLFHLLNNVLASIFWSCVNLRLIEQQIKATPMRCVLCDLLLTKLKGL